MDNLTAYRAIKAHFEMPGARLAKNTDGECYYRCPRDFGPTGPREGDKCSFGVLIPDDVYVAMKTALVNGPEGRSAGEFIRDCKTHGLGDGIFDNLDTELMDEIQFQHDTAISVEDFLSKLDNLMIERGIISSEDQQ